MSAKDITLDVFGSQPCRAFLGALERLPYGRKILNKCSHQRGVFSTFEEAWSVARQRKRVGHEHPEAIELEFELSRALRPSDYPVLYWLSRIAMQDDKLKIFDFGGNAGNLYYIYSKYLQQTVQNITWTVFDLPAIIEEGRKIALRRGATRLRFTTSTADASDAAALLVSSAFHYWEKSVEAFIGQFPRPPEHIILNRTPVHKRCPTFITVQCAGLYAVPCAVRNATELTSSFAALGYTLVDRWPALEQRLVMPLFPNRTVPHSSGFYFRRQQAP